MARKKTNKRKSPYEVADEALRHLLDNIDEMVKSYRDKMYKFANDPDAQSAYLAGVATWTAVMRSSEISNEIARAIAKAKEKYRAIMRSATAKARAAVKVPLSE